MADSSRYMLYKKVARGGMAEIYLGKQIGEDGFQRICCIKRILPHYAQDQEFIEMFRDEAHICKRLQHANIVRVEGFEEVEGSYAIIMEFINGGDLRTVLSSCEKQNHQLSVPMTLYIIAEAARGLHFAHCKVDDLTGKPLEIVHRDISPQNILISFEGEVKVTDFGIADADSKETETKPGIVKGKYSYMSPEQISAMSVDARTDVFALAIVLWEMLAMKRLFQGENEVMTIQMVRSCQISEDLRKLNSKVDNELYQLLMKGLSKDPRSRFSSAAEFEKALRKYINKRYADFTVNDLAEFIKKLMSARLKEMQLEIKNLLSKQVPSQNPFMSNTPATGSNFQVEHHSASFKPKAQGQTKSSKPKGGFSGRQPEFSVISGVPGTGRHAIGRSSNHQRSNDAPRSAPLPGAHQHYRHSSRRSQSYSSPTGAYMLLLVLVLVLGGIGFVAYKKDIFGTDMGKLRISTTPDNVTVWLDGKPLFGGQYVKTPLDFTPAKGKGRGRYRIISKEYEDSAVLNSDKSHVLVVRRSGFKDERFVFKVDKDLERFLVLDKMVDIAPTRLRLKSKRFKSVWVKMDDGEITEELNASEPYDARDITFGEVHVFWVYPYGFRSKKGVFNCRVIPRAKNWIAPYLVDIYPESRKCKTPHE
ncbi:MAG: serine/threonine protein kinase [Oligoflexales bacterium]